MSVVRVVNNGGGASPLTGLQLAAKPAEAALWPHIRAYAADRKGWLWKAGKIDAALHAAGETDRLRGGLSTDHMTRFLTRDLFGRKLVPRDNNAVKRHAYLVKQVRDGSDVVVFNRPCLQIGMSADGATLTYGKGGLEPYAATNEDCFQAGGWTAIWDILIFPNSGSVNCKVTYADDSVAQWAVNNGSQPWAIMGSQALRNATGKAFSIFFDFATSPGRLFMRNRGGTDLWNNTTHGTDYRTGTRYVFMAGYDPVSQVMSLYRQDNSETVAIATKSSVSVDLDVTPTGGKKARLYGIGTEGDGSSIYCNGAFSSLNGWLPDATLHTDATKRALLWDWADEL